jgi:transcriptional repressor NrdR
VDAERGESPLRVLTTERPPARVLGERRRATAPGDSRASDARMRCPFCGHLEDRVLDSRTSREGFSVKRRRECVGCLRRFTTYEQIEELQVVVVKKDGRREPFDRAKIMRGMQLACLKRPVSADTLEQIADAIERAIYDLGQREVPSGLIGEHVVEAMRGLDPVAYVRFASVYRDFQDATQFKEIVERLRPESASKQRAARTPGAKGDRPRPSRAAAS